MVAIIIQHVKRNWENATNAKTGPKGNSAKTVVQVAMEMQRRQKVASRVNVTVMEIKRLEFVMFRLVNAFVKITQRV